MANPVDLKNDYLPTGKILVSNESAKDLNINLIGVEELMNYWQYSTCTQYLRQYITCSDGASMLVGWYGHVTYDCNTGDILGGHLDFISPEQACETHGGPGSPAVPN